MSRDKIKPKSPDMSGVIRKDGNANRKVSNERLNASSTSGPVVLPARDTGHQALHRATFGYLLLKVFYTIARRQYLTSC